MTPYLYIAQKNRLGKNTCFIYGCLKARDDVEAYKNSRILVRERSGGVISGIIIKRL